MEVYCISLRKHQKKWHNLINYISAQGFPNPKIFEAVDGSILKEISETNDISKYPYIEHILLKLGIKTIEQLLSIWTRFNLNQNINRKFHGQLPSWGAVGCYLSHVYIWIMMIEKGVEQFCVFEDDVVFEQGFKNKYNEIMSSPPEDADVIFLDVAWSEKSIIHNNNFKKILGNFFGTHAYIMSTDTARKLIKDIFPIEIQIDAYMSYFSGLNKMNMYHTEGLCKQKYHVSSIQKPCLICDITSDEINGTTKFVFVFFVFCVLLIFILIVIIILMYINKKKLKH